MPDPELKLIVVFGLPGTGKTTLATALAKSLGWPHANTDGIRSDLGLRGQYDPRTKEEVYAALEKWVRERLVKGSSVVIDATFHKAATRQRYTELAAELGAGCIWICTVAGEETVRRRVSGSRPLSEADFSVYQKVREGFEPHGGPVLTVDTETEKTGDAVVRIGKVLGYGQD